MRFQYKMIVSEAKNILDRNNDLLDNSDDAATDDDNALLENQLLKSADCVKIAVFKEANATK